jgi:hypothetical protein
LEKQWSFSQIFYLISVTELSNNYKTGFTNMLTLSFLTLLIKVGSVSIAANFTSFSGSRSSYEKIYINVESDVSFPNA